MPSLPGTAIPNADTRTHSSETPLRVGLADLVQQYHTIQPQVDSAIKQVLESGQFVLGEQVNKLEEEIAAACGAKHGVAVNSGTDALLLALVADGVGPGDEVITSPFTFVATVEAICLAGATPVFADIDPKSFNLCPEKVAAKLSPRTKAIMPVDLYGQMADRTAFTDLAEKHGLLLIWDSAQSIGARFEDKPLGEFPGCATLSFFPTKNLGAYGDGGMVLTNDTALRDRLIQYKFHGMNGGYLYERIGYCSRLDADVAAILCAKLPYLDTWNRARREHAEIYMECSPGQKRACPTSICAPGTLKFHQFTIRHSRRDQLQAHLKEQGVDSGIYYPLALHIRTRTRISAANGATILVSERATREVLSLPVCRRSRENKSNTSPVLSATSDRSTLLMKYPGLPNESHDSGRGRWLAASIP